MKDNKRSRKSIYLLLALVTGSIVLVWVALSGSPSGNSSNTVPISQVFKDISASPSPVKEIRLLNDSEQLQILYNDGSLKYAYRELSGSTFTDQLSQVGIKLTRDQDIKVSEPSSLSGIFGFLIYMIPTLLFIGVLVFMMRGSQSGNSQAMNFGKSRARLFNAEKTTVTFNDVAGIEESKQELAEIVEFLKFPEKFLSLGARIPHGLLLIGPPGTGKTLLAKAVAGEAGVPFFSISGSEFVEMFVGVGASRVRDLFTQAKKSAPCIIFIDEIDAVGRQRGINLGGGNDEREQTLNQILVEMDGFDTSTNIIVIAATNRADVLDPALVRPGRFDRQVTLDLPDLVGRAAILKVHIKGKPLAQDVLLDVLAKQTIGFSGAELANLLNEAAILAARRSKTTISMQEMEEATLRVMAGPERRSMVISKAARLITAYHEVGHAVVARVLPGMDPVHKISIIPRGRAGGFTMILPAEDRGLTTRGQLETQITWGLGGRAAEELIFSSISSGASDDINRVTEIAREMITSYGMSENLGPIAFGKGQHMTLMGRGLNGESAFSKELAYQIDQETRQLINKCYARARNILLEHRAELEKITQLLLEKETLEGAEFEQQFAMARPEPLPFYRD